MYMLGRGAIMLKSLMKSSLDHYILPGALTGSEILWIYAVQWKRDVGTLLFASVYFFCSQFDAESTENTFPNLQEKPTPSE